MTKEQARNTLRELDRLAEDCKVTADALREVRDADYEEGKVLNGILLQLSLLVHEVQILEALSYHTLREESHGDEEHQAEA